MTKPDPVFEGLALGLRPADLELPDDAIHVDLKIVKARERIRLVQATERQTELAEQNLALQRRIADAAERSASAFETVAALLASCIGVSDAWCPGGVDDRPAVNYIRASGDGKTFRCDQVDSDDGED